MRGKLPVDPDAESGRVCVECGEAILWRDLAPCADRKVRHRLCMPGARAQLERAADANAVRRRRGPDVPPLVPTRDRKAAGQPRLL